MTLLQPASSTRGGPFIDFHTHSTASDGSVTPAGVVEAARAAGLHAIALTDHDTISGVPDARAAGERLGVRVVAGVELSAMYLGLEIHVLGLHLDRIEGLEAQLVIFRETRRRRADEIVSRLNALDVPITLEAVLAVADGGAIGRPHVARALVAGGWVRDFREAFDRFLGAGKPAFVAKHLLTVAESIRLIHEAGGLAILAHPGPLGTPERVEAFVALGLDGLEVRHPGHPPEDTRRLAALVERYSLVPSGGSDWHGAGDGPRSIGSMQVPSSWAERQDARVAARSPRELVA